MQVHLNNRPLASDHHPGSVSCHSHVGCSSSTAMGYHVIRVQLPDPVPQHEGTRQCRWFIAFAPQPPPPPPPPGTEASRDAACYNLGQIQALPVTTVKVGSCSRHNPQVSRVMHFTCCGWPSSVPSDLKPFYSRWKEIAC